MLLFFYNGDSERTDQCIKKCILESERLCCIGGTGVDKSDKDDTDVNNDDIKDSGCNGGGDRESINIKKLYSWKLKAVLYWGAGVDNSDEGDTDDNDDDIDDSSCGDSERINNKKWELKVEGCVVLRELELIVIKMILMEMMMILVIVVVGGSGDSERKKHK